MNSIEKMRLAIAALETAKKACDDAEFSINGNVLRRCRADEDLLEVSIRMAGSRIRSLEHRQKPIALGDTVRVTGWNAVRHIKVTSVGTKLIHLGEVGASYKISDGRAHKAHSNTEIDPDDLFRVQRDLVNQRPPKPPKPPKHEVAMREVTTLTKKGSGDESK